MPDDLHAAMKRMGTWARGVAKSEMGAFVRISMRHVVRATPKRTGFAANFSLALNSFPDLVPGQPDRDRYALIGDAEVDEVMMPWEPGDWVGAMSPADYFKYLTAGSSPQNPDPNWVPNALDAAAVEFAARS